MVDKHPICVVRFLGRVAAITCMIDANYHIKLQRRLPNAFARGSLADAAHSLASYAGVPVFHGVRIQQLDRTGLSTTSQSMYTPTNRGTPPPPRGGRVSARRPRLLPPESGGYRRLPFGSEEPSDDSLSRNSALITVRRRAKGVAHRQTARNFRRSARPFASLSECDDLQTDDFRSLRS